MKKKNTSFCNFAILLSICLIVYILITDYFEYFHLENGFNISAFVVKVVLFSILFVVVTLVYRYFTRYENSYLEKQINERTSKILNENKNLKVNANVDILTQCLNKKYFMERFKEELKRAIREKQRLSLLIVNIDEFKAFNDIYGRAEGDECLKLVANVLVSNCNRPSDLVSRFDGDEFYILLPNTTEPKVVSQKCVEKVKSLQIPHDNSIASNVLTISIGVATIIPLHPDQENELIAYAKESLVNAKKSGRNRVY